MSTKGKRVSVFIASAVLVVMATALAEDINKGSDDYRPTIWGMNGNTPWSSLLPADDLKGLDVDKNWRREGNALIGANKEGSATATFGEEGWKDYEIDFDVTLLEGYNLDVGFRSSTANAYVFKFLLGWQACTVTLRDFSGKQPLDHLSVVNHKLERNKAYHVQIAVRGSSITTYVDGKLVNQVTDKTLKAGKWYLEVWQGSAKFQNIRHRRIG